MFIEVDEPNRGVKIESLKQLIPKAGRYVHFLVDEGKSDRIKEKWKDWFKGVESKEPNSGELHGTFNEGLNLVKSFPSGCESLSTLCSKGDIELLNYMIEKKPITLSELTEIEGVIGGLVGGNTSVSIYDRYLLKHNAHRLRDMGDTECDLNPLNNLIILLKGMNDKPPLRLYIYSEFFQKREFAWEYHREAGDGGSPEDAEPGANKAWKELIEGPEYAIFIRSLMEVLIEKIRSLYPGFRRTEITLYDCTRLQYKKGKLPHDRFLELNEIVMVSTSGFNFEVKNWGSEEYIEFTSKESSEIKGGEIRPTRLIPLTHMGRGPRDRDTIRYTAGMT